MAFGIRDFGSSLKLVRVEKRPWRVQPSHVPYPVIFFSVIYIFLILLCFSIFSGIESQVLLSDSDKEE